MNRDLYVYFEFPLICKVQTTSIMSGTSKVFTFTFSRKQIDSQNEPWVPINHKEQNDQQA